VESCPGCNSTAGPTAAAVGLTRSRRSSCAAQRPVRTAERRRSRFRLHLAGRDDSPGPRPVVSRDPERAGGGAVKAGAPGRCGGARRRVAVILGTRRPGRKLKELFASLGGRSERSAAHTGAAGVSMRSRRGDGRDRRRQGRGQEIHVRRARRDRPGCTAVTPMRWTRDHADRAGGGIGREFRGAKNPPARCAKRHVARGDRGPDREMIAFSELGTTSRRADQDPRTALLVRLGFSVAAQLAESVLIDEVLAVGEEAFQRKWPAGHPLRIEQGTDRRALSQGAGTIERACRRVVVLDSPRAVAGPTAEGLAF